MWRLGGLAFCAIGIILPAHANPAAPDTTYSIERHFTTNALDSDLVIADFYTLLRGTLRRTFDRPTGHVRLSAAFNATKYDRIEIEDDRALKQKVANLDWNIRPLLFA